MKKTRKITSEEIKILNTPLYQKFKKEFNITDEDILKAEDEINPENDSLEEQLKKISNKGFFEPNF